jgi:hypothetical protein
VQSLSFSSKCKGKYSEVEIDLLKDQIAHDPKAGHQLPSTNCVYRLAWARTVQHEYEYDVFYVYHSSQRPILIVNIFRKGEADALSKVIATITEELTRT